MGSFLHEGIPDRIEDKTLYLAFGKNNGFHINSIMRSHKVIEETLYNFFGVHLKIKCIQDENISRNEQKAPYPRSLDSIAKNVPHFNTIMEVFDGELIK